MDLKRRSGFESAYERGHRAIQGGERIHPARLSPEIFRRDVTVQATRGSGPGGQHRNRVDTAVRMIHNPTGIRAQAGERRSRHANESRAFKRLRLKVALQHREPLDLEHVNPPGIFEPSRLWRSRLQGKRIPCSVEHEDFPALLAEALDVIHHFGYDVPRAARLLETSTAQLVRFLGREAAALRLVNEVLVGHGRKPYRTD